MPQPADHEQASRLARRNTPRCASSTCCLPTRWAILRGKRVTIEELEGYPPRRTPAAGSMFALDVLGGTMQETGLGFDEGDADRVCLPIPGTLVPVPWLGNEGRADAGQHVRARRPAVFRRSAPRAGRRAAALRDLGLTPVMAVELEFYLVDRERTAGGHAQPPRLPLHRPARVPHADQLDGGPQRVLGAARRDRRGRPRAGDALGHGARRIRTRPVRSEPASRRPMRSLACDHAIRLKRLVRGVALRHGMEATFMPKPYRDHAGSGAHLHVSLVDEQGRNIFASEDPAGSPQLRHAIGGLAATMDDAMAIFAPTANSYRRFQPEAYVPLNPSWAVNNRGVALRVPHGAAREPPRRASRRGRGRESLPARRGRAGRHASRARTRQLDPGPPLAGNAYRDTRADDPAHLAGGRSRPSSAARSCASTSASAFTRPLRRGRDAARCRNSSPTYRRSNTPGT